MMRAMVKTAYDAGVIAAREKRAVSPAWIRQRVTQALPKVSPVRAGRFVDNMSGMEFGYAGGGYSKAPNADLRLRKYRAAADAVPHSSWEAFTTHERGLRQAVQDKLMEAALHPVQREVAAVRDSVSDVETLLSQFENRNRRPLPWTTPNATSVKQAYDAGFAAAFEKFSMMRFDLEQPWYDSLPPEVQQQALQHHSAINQLARENPQVENFLHHPGMTEHVHQLAQLSNAQHAIGHMGVSPKEGSALGHLGAHVVGHGLGEAAAHAVGKGYDALKANAAAMAPEQKKKTWNMASTALAPGLLGV